jgi:hypothetical protein
LGKFGPSFSCELGNFLTRIFFPPLGVVFGCADSFVVVDGVFVEIILAAVVVVVVRNVVVIFVVPIKGTTIFWPILLG